MTSKYPGWRTMTAAQRRNAKMDRIFEAAKEAKTRFNLSSRGDREAAKQDALRRIRQNASTWQNTEVYL